MRTHPAWRDHELQEAVCGTDFLKLFADWHEVGTAFKNGLSTYNLGGEFSLGAEQGRCALILP